MKVFRDERGLFIKPFHAGLFAELGLETDFKEDFYSVSKKGVLRGFHFQTPPEQHSKLVYCSRGSILDVVVDLRVGSNSYGECSSLELSESNGKALFIPEGMAHAFLALSDEATVHYKVSTVHAPAFDSGLLWSSVGFDWSSYLSGRSQPIVSPRDAGFQALKDFTSPFKFSAGDRPL